MRKLIVLGSTGSIGVNTLEVAAHLGPTEIEVVGLSAHRRVDRLREQAARWRPRHVVVTDPAAHAALAREWSDRNGTLLRGPEGVAAMIRDSGADLVLQAMVGAAGLPASLLAVEQGIDLAIANKESLVIAGPLLLAAAQRSGARLIPVDSEHSAIYQAIGDEPREHVRRILLTASGGPFLTTPLDRLASLTPAEALRHPVWKMGPKVTVDSATMMNKALEIVEARWLFGIEAQAIEVVIHPQGVVHSMVEFRDGNVLAQLGPPDMKIPIQYALTRPPPVAGHEPGIQLRAFRVVDLRAAGPDAFSRAHPGIRGRPSRWNLGCGAQCGQRGGGDRLSGRAALVPGDSRPGESRGREPCVCSDAYPGTADGH